MVIISKNPAQKMSGRVNHPGQFSARTTSLFWSVFNERQQITALGEDRPSSILKSVAKQLGIEIRVAGHEPEDLKVKLVMRNQHLLILLEQISEQLGNKADVINRPGEIELRYWDEANEK